MQKKIKGLLFLAAVLAAPRAAPADTDASAAARGRVAFEAMGCYECHGYIGQGSYSTGPKLAPGPLPYPALSAYVRAPKGQMPPYSEKILKESDLRDIYAYLASIPPAPAVDDIPLLAGARAKRRLAPGEALFAAQCAACHGAGGAGGAAPRLRGLGARRSAAQIAAYVMRPAGNMPRLYPGALSRRDVEAVAAYVHSLK